jgi:hypothetical protein
LEQLTLQKYHSGWSGSGTWIWLGAKCCKW